MSNYAFQPLEFEPNSKIMATLWLKLGVFSLIASGIFSLLLVASRTPGVQSIIPWVDFFHTTLVVHVNLSVVIWFIAFAGVLWALNSRLKTLLWDKLIVWGAILGTVLIVLAPFTGDGNPILNNYVPVLQQPVFLGGQALFGLSFVALVVRSLFTFSLLRQQDYKDNHPISFAIYFSVIAAAMALIALFISSTGIPPTYKGEAYFELLYWGGGHTLQFTHTFLLLAVWVWLARASGIDLGISRNGMFLLFLLMLVPLIAVPVIYLVFPIASIEHRVVFTELMKYGGLTSLPLGALVAFKLMTAIRATHPAYKPLRSALYCSIILFAAGGVIGFLIDGANVVIPAHYHGSIVGVTLAFMGFTYYLLPLLGFNTPRSRLANIQPYVYGGGQLMHILGLAWSGGYGVQRKTAGAAQGLDKLPEILGMGMMGLGGLISIIGGVIFLVVVLQSFYGRKYK